MEFFKDGKVCFDVGSNVGGMAHEMLAMGASEVHLFEPAPLIMERAYYLADLFPQAKVVFNTVGVSDHEGELKNVRLMNCWTLQGDGQNVGYPESPGALAIQPTPFDMTFTTLDLYAERNGIDRLDLIKIDVEGYEPKVLRGAEKVISKFNPLLMVELSMYVNDIGESADGFIKYLMAMPYDWVSYTGEVCSESMLTEKFPYHSSYDIYGTPKK